MFVFNPSVSCISLLVVAVIVLYIQFFNLHLSPVAISLDTTYCLANVLYGIIVVSSQIQLVGELRDNSLYVPGFQTSELICALCIYIIARYLLS